MDVPCPGARPRSGSHLIRVDVAAFVTPTGSEKICEEEPHAAGVNHRGTRRVPVMPSFFVTTLKAVPNATDVVSVVGNRRRHGTR